MPIGRKGALGELEDIVGGCLDFQMARPLRLEVGKQRLFGLCLAESKMGSLTFEMLNV